MNENTNRVLASVDEAVAAVAAEEYQPDTFVVPEGHLADTIRKEAGAAPGEGVRAHLANEDGEAVLVIDDPVRITRPPRPSDYGSYSVNWSALLIAIVATVLAVLASLAVVL